MPSKRLPHFDYAGVGPYFLTVCSYQRSLLFSEPEAAAVIEGCWHEIPAHFAVELDEFVVMPNHIHGVLWMRAGHARPLQSVVGAFKAAASRRINELRGTPGARVWQRGYYDHVIRDEADLARVREYIATNPIRWELDPENPAMPARP